MIRSSMCSLSYVGPHRLTQSKLKHFYASISNKFSMMFTFVWLAASLFRWKDKRRIECVWFWRFNIILWYFLVSVSVNYRLKQLMVFSLRRSSFCVIYGNEACQHNRRTNITAAYHNVCVFDFTVWRSTKAHRASVSCIWINYWEIISGCRWCSACGRNLLKLCVK